MHGPRPAQQLGSDNAKVDTPAMKRAFRELRGAGASSDSGLLTLLKKLKQEPKLLEDAPDSRQVLQSEGLRDYQQYARKAVIPTITETGVEGGPFEWEHAEAGLLLSFFCKESEVFNRIMEQTVTHLRGAPLDVILYYDEITPGRVLAPDNHRKMHAIYFSFRQFPAWFLRSVCAWLPLGVLRSCTVNKFPASFSTAMKYILEALVVDASLSQGVTIPFPSGPRLVFARVTNNLADGAALKAALGCKGAAGTQPCTSCKNVVSKAFEELLAADEYVCSICCTDMRKFDPRCDQDVWDAVDSLQAQHPLVSKKAFEDLQKSLGFQHLPQGVLLCRALREHFGPIATLTYDPAHVWLSNGIANGELWLLMTALGTCQVTWGHVQAWMKADRCWPLWAKAKGKAIHNCFNESRRKAACNAKEFKSGCTETVQVVPLMRHFLVTVIVSDVVAEAKLDKEISSFNALADVVLCLQSMKVSSNPQALTEHLQSAIARHLSVFKAAYSEDHMVWKHHVAMHVPMQVHRDKCLLDSLPLERKHQDLKTEAESIKNMHMSSFERTVLLRSVNGQLRSLAGLQFVDKLMGEALLVPGCPAEVSVSLHFRGMQFHRGDVLIASPTQVGRMVGALQEGHRFTVIVERLRLVRAFSEGFVVSSTETSMELWPLGAGFDVRQAGCWHPAEGGGWIVLF